ncbi:MAG: CPBP family intramembrane glutamic endopeptidase [Candidatus Bilamarchaeaceae archaeon]
MAESRASLAQKEVITFLVLTFALSAILYYLVMADPAYTTVLMWCPAVSAVATRLYWQRNLDGFGFGLGEKRWVLVGIGLPILLGLVMFGYVWLAFGDFNPAGLLGMFSLSFVPVFLMLLFMNIFAAAGEEIGWRGLLVPEMSKFMGFTKLALISGAIWAAWHLPIIIFGFYHGAGSPWFSLLAFVPETVCIGVVFAWLRLRSGSVWPVVMFHGFWNYFIQTIFPVMTFNTPETLLITGEFGWLSPLLCIVLALVCFKYKDRLPKMV